MENTNSRPIASTAPSMELWARAPKNVSSARSCARAWFGTGATAVVLERACGTWTPPGCQVGDGAVGEVGLGVQKRSWTALAFASAFTLQEARKMHSRHSTEVLSCNSGSPKHGGLAGWVCCGWPNCLLYSSPSLTSLVAVVLMPQRCYSLAVRRLDAHHRHA